MLMDLSALSISALVGIYNSAISLHTLPVAPVNKFATKADAVKRLTTLLTMYDLGIVNNEDILEIVRVNPEPVEEVTQEEAEAALIEAAAEAETAATEEDAVITPSVEPVKEVKAAIEAAKAKKAKKAKKAPVEASAKRGPAPVYADNQTITILVANPKRPGSAAHERFAKYTEGMTVAAAIAAGLRRDDFRWDTAHGHIAIK